MSYNSIRNKALVEFPNGKLMLLCEISDSSTRDLSGRRVWDKGMFHPKGTLFFTKESLKQEQSDYVERQFSNMREMNRLEVERGYASEYIEPSLDSYDYNGTRWPGGSRIRNGKAFFSGRPIKAEEYFRRWDAPRRIHITAYDKDKKTYEDTFDILRADLDECYQDALAKGNVYIGIH